jgi:hypothetical protein
MDEKPRESLGEALNSYLADHAHRSGSGEGPPADRPRVTGTNATLNDAYQAIVEAYRPGRPVDPSRSALSEPAPSEPVAGKQRLLEAYDRLVEHEATKPRGFLPPMTARWRRFVTPTIGAVSLAATIYLSVAKPAWLYPTFDPPPAPTTDAAAEQVLIAGLIMVQQFEADSGRLPRNPTEVGIDPTAVSILPTGGGGYRLATSVGSRTLSILVTPGADPEIERSGGAQ